MKRSDAREIAVRICFGLSATGGSAEEQIENFFDREYYETLSGEDEVFSAYPNDKQKQYIESIVKGVSLHSAELDDYVEKYSKGWKFQRISRTALAIMKTAMYEIMYMPDIPNGAAINEAVELAKKYEEPETVPFINGVLGSFLRNEAEQL